MYTKKIVAGLQAVVGLVFGGLCWVGVWGVGGGGGGCFGWLVHKGKSFFNIPQTKRNRRRGRVLGNGGGHLYANEKEALLGKGGGGPSPA